MKLTQNDPGITSLLNETSSVMYSCVDLYAMKEELDEDQKQLSSAISTMIQEGDLTQLTKKVIRAHLEEQFNADLVLKHKDFIKAQITKFVNAKQ